MTSLAVALVVLGALAFAAFVLWLRRQDGPDVEARLAKMEVEIEGFIGAATAARKRLDTTEATVETLAIAFGLKGKEQARKV